MSFSDLKNQLHSLWRRAAAVEWMQAYEGVLVALVVFTVAVAAWASFRHDTIESQRELMREDVLRVAVSAARIVDGSRHEMLSDPRQGGGTDYQEVIAPLVALNNGIPEIARLYTLRERDGKLYYVLDTAQSGDWWRPHSARVARKMFDPYVGSEPNDGQTKLDSLQSGVPGVALKPFQSEGRFYLTAEAPFRNASGDIVGLVGVDFDVGNYLARVDDARWMGVWTLWLSALVAVILGFLVGGIKLALVRTRKVMPGYSSSLSLAERRDAIAAVVACMSEKGIIFTDTGGTIEWVSHGFCTISGFSETEACGRNVSRLLSGPEIDPPRWYALMREALLQGLPFRGRELHYSKTFEDYRVDIEAVPVRDEKGAVTRFVLIETPAGDQGLMEDGLISARDEAEEADRGKSRFLGVMAHEIRTPLNGIIGFVSLLRETPLDERQRRFAESIETSGKSLLRLLDDILDVSRIEAGNLTMKRKPVALRQLLDHVVQVHSALCADKRIELRSHFANGTPEWILGDPERWEQILTILVGNAVKFTGKGSVSVSIEGLARNPEGVLQVTVEDTGVGIAGQDLRRLFRPFGRVDSSIVRKHGGLGLGLAICHHLVGRLGGELRVDSEEGKGSRFYFGVPLESSVPEAIEAIPALLAASTPPSAKLKILVAEDNVTNRRLIRMILRNFGHTVHVVADGQECVDAVAREDYDLIFMDLQMPRMDGYTAAARLRGMGKSVWITVLTAEPMEDDPLKYSSRGIDDYVGKPYTKALIGRAIDRFLFTRPSRFSAG